jgi:hypothetical protein
MSVNQNVQVAEKSSNEGLDVVEAEKDRTMESFRGYVRTVSCERQTLCSMLAILTAEANWILPVSVWSWYVYNEALVVQASIDKLDDNFKVKTAGTDGMELHLEQIKTSCEEQHPHVGIIQAPHLAQSIHTTCRTEASLEDDMTHVDDDLTKSTIESFLSGASYRPEELFHEAAMKSEFRVWWPDKLRDSNALREARFNYQRGCYDLVYAELDGQLDDQLGDKTYVHVSTAIDIIWRRIQGLEIHADYEMLHDMLAKPNLHKFLLKDDNLKWSKLQEILDMIIHAMSQCVGNACARLVLYKERVSERSVKRSEQLVEVIYTLNPKH